MKVLMHPKPMKRHTQHVTMAECHSEVHLPGDGSVGTPGLHLVLQLEDGATQRVIFQLNQLSDLSRDVQVAMAAA